MTDSIRPTPKGAPRKVRDVSPADDETRKSFMAFRHALGWSQLRTALELGVARSTVEDWESPHAHRNCRIPATAFNFMRRLAREQGCDSLGRMKIA